MSEPRKERAARPRRRGGGRPRDTRPPKGSDNDIQANINPKVALKELFPDWGDDDLETVLADSQGELDEAVQRITDGRAQQWGRVTTRKQRKEEQSSAAAPDVPAKDHSKRDHDQERRQKPKKKVVANGAPKNLPNTTSAPKQVPPSGPAPKPAPTTSVPKPSQKPSAGGSMSWAEMLSRPKVPEPEVEQYPAPEKAAPAVADEPIYEQKQPEVQPVQPSQPTKPAQPPTNPKGHTEEPKKSSVPNGAVSWVAALSAQKQNKPAEKKEEAEPVVNAAKSAPSEIQSLENASSENEGTKNRRRRGGQRQKKPIEPENQNGDIETEQVNIQFGSFGLSEETPHPAVGGPVEIKTQPRIPEVPVGPRGSSIRRSQVSGKIPTAPAVPPSIVPQVPQVPPAVPPAVPQVPLASFSHPTPHADPATTAESVPQASYGEVPFEAPSPYGYGMGYPPRYNYGEYGGYDLAAQQFYYPAQIPQVPQAPAAGAKSGSSTTSPMPFAHPAPYFMAPSAYYYGYPGYGNGMMLPAQAQSPAPGHPQQQPIPQAQAQAPGHGQGQPNKNSPYFWQYGQ